MRLKDTFLKIKQILLASVLVLVACGGFVLGWADHAYAGNDASDVVQSRAEKEVDRVMGKGTVNQVKGNAQENLGRVQRQLGNDVEGSARQVRGKVQKDIGRTQKAAEDTAESADGLIDQVKDFFN